MTIRTATTSVPVAAGLFAAAAVAWLVVVAQAGGMESAPGTMGLSAAAFLGLWAVMMAAMMLPGAGAARRALRRRGRRAGAARATGSRPGT